MKTIYEDLTLIRRRLGMFIGSKRVSDLFTFAAGYTMALGEDAGRRLHTANGLPFRWLHWHLGRKYRLSPSMGWARILLEVTGSEEAGLEQFFPELEEFEALRILRVEEPALTEENLRYNREEPSVPKIGRSDGTWSPVYSDAARIFRLSLSRGPELLGVERGRTRGPFRLVELEPLNDIQGRIAQCFGPAVWQKSEEDFLGERLLSI